MATKKTITHLSVVLGVSALAVSLPGQAADKDILGYTGLASQQLNTVISQPVRTQGLIGGQMLTRDMGLQANDMLVNNNIKLQDRKLINRDHMVRNTATQINTIGHMDGMNTVAKSETRWNNLDRDTLRTRATTTAPALKGKVISNDMLGQRDLTMIKGERRLNIQGRDVLRTRSNDMLGQRDLTMIKGERRSNTLGQDSLRVRNINSQPVLKGKLLRNDSLMQRDLNNSVKADRHLNTQGRDVLRTRSNDMLGQRDLTMIKGERRSNTLGQDSLRVRNINSQPVLKGKLLRNDSLMQRDLNNSVKADRHLNTQGRDVLRTRVNGLDMVRTNDLNSQAKDYIIDIDMPKHVRTMMPARDRGMPVSGLNNSIIDRDVKATRKVARIAQPTIGTVNTHTANGIVDMKTLSNSDMTNVRINGVVAHDCLTGCATSVKGLVAPMGLNKPVNGLIKDQKWTRFNK